MSDKLYETFTVVVSRLSREELNPIPFASLVPDSSETYLTTMFAFMCI